MTFGSGLRCCSLRTTRTNETGAGDGSRGLKFGILVGMAIGPIGILLAIVVAVILVSVVVLVVFAILRPTNRKDE